MAGVCLRVRVFTAAHELLWERRAVVSTRLSPFSCRCCCLRLRLTRQQVLLSRLREVTMLLIPVPSPLSGNCHHGVNLHCLSTGTS